MRGVARDSRINAAVARSARFFPPKPPKFPAASSPLPHPTRPPRHNSTRDSRIPDGEWHWRQRQRPRRRPSLPGAGAGGGIEDVPTRTMARAARAAAVGRAGVSVGASQPQDSSSENNGLRTMFRNILMEHVKKVSKYYLEHKLLTEAAYNAVRQKVVEKIIARESNQLPPTKSWMEDYISDHKEDIKIFVKERVEEFWYY